MSENWLILIPADPFYIPDPEAQKQAYTLFKSFVPLADEVKINTTSELEFVVTGGNLERIRCPLCAKELDMNWWIQAMDTAYSRSKFRDLEIRMPCCGAISTLNALQYEQPTGFTRFRLEARNPTTDIDARNVDALEHLLTCTLRKIWSHM